MAWHRRRRSAYYSRNDSYSRSANAESAEEAGRYPRTRAAAELGVSVKAFDAGCAAAEYRSHEWHHVSKYANMVDYFDTVELAESVEFWEGAAACYKSKTKQAELRAKVPELLEARKAERYAAFKARLVRQRDCTRPVLRGSNLTADNWRRYVKSAAGHYHIAPVVKPGDFDGLRATIAAAKLEVARERLAAKLTPAPSRHPRTDWPQVFNRLGWQFWHGGTNWIGAKNGIAIRFIEEKACAVWHRATRDGDRWKMGTTEGKIPRKELHRWLRAPEQMVPA